MNPLNLTLLVTLLANLCLINCLDNEGQSSPQSNLSTVIKVTADQNAYNPGQQVIVDAKFENIEHEFTLKLACRDEEKCAKVFNCTSNCGEIEVPKKNSAKQLKLMALSSGNVILYLTNTTNETDLYPDLRESFVRISVGQSKILDYLSVICGWIYFFAWSISFYPQIVLNIKRKSVVGLNFDFIALNVTGFFFYSIFNVAMRYVPSVRAEYLSAHPFSLIPVEDNDVVFAVHAFIVSVVTLVQCFCIYERQNQTISKPSVGLLITFWTIAIIATLLLAFRALNVLVYLNLLSYIKLLISFIKYIPQAYYNYQRKSTVGWSIGNILFDLTGGFFSLLQICLINFNYDDWGNIKGNLTKFGLGLLSMSFDFLFITQHYFLYKDRSEHEPVQNSETSSDSNINKA